MEDFDYQYIKKNSAVVEDINRKIDFVKENIKNIFLNEAITHFKEITDRKIEHHFIKNHQPFKESFFAETIDNNLQIPLDKLGSGYEMIFSILYSFYLSRQSNKQLLIFIDEPELHLHPVLQSKFVKILLEFSKTAQIILTTHSPLFVKQLLGNKEVLVNIIKNREQIEILPLEKRLLPFLSSSEINYLAFDLPNEEYHNELYGYIQEETQNETLNDMDTYLFNKGIPKNKEWIKLRNGIMEPAISMTLPTYIRNSIHHPENTFNSPYSSNELNASIQQLTGLFPILG